MKLVEIAIGTVLRIPDSWTYFTYRGLNYRRDTFGRWVIDRRAGAKVA